MVPIDSSAAVNCPRLPECVSVNVDKLVPGMIGSMSVSGLAMSLLPFLQMTALANDGAGGAEGPATPGREMTDRVEATYPLDGGVSISPLVVEAHHRAVTPSPISCCKLPPGMPGDSG